MKLQIYTTECNSCLSYSSPGLSSMACKQTTGQPGPNKDEVAGRGSVDCTRIGGSLPRKAACRQIEYVLGSATQTRKSLVKGERFIRSVWMAEMAERCDRGGDPDPTSLPGPITQAFYWFVLKKVLQIEKLGQPRCFSGHHVSGKLKDYACWIET